MLTVLVPRALLSLNWFQKTKTYRLTYFLFKHNTAESLILKTVPGFSRSFTKGAFFILSFCTKRYLKKTGFITGERKFFKELLEVHFGLDLLH